MAPKKPGPNVKKFGMPLYASAWLDERTLVVAGGGGKKSSGIPNRMCVATFDGVTLSEPLFSCHTDETAPQGLIPTPDKTRLLCVFSGDVALYDVAPNPDPPDTLGDTEESDPPPTSGPAVVPCTIVPSDPIADGVAHRITLADCDIKCAAFSSDGERLAVGLEDGRVQLCAWRRATEKDLHIEVVATLGQHTDAVTGIAFSPDDTLILTTSAESASKPGQGAAVWSVAEKSRVRALSDPSVPAAARGASYRFAAFGPAGSNSAYTCLNIGGEGYATRWNTRDWTVISRRRVGLESRHRRRALPRRRMPRRRRQRGPRRHPRRRHIRHAIGGEGRAHDFRHHRRVQRRRYRRAQRFRRRLRVRQRRQEIGRGGVRRARHLRRLRVFGAGVALRLRRIARGVPLRVRREGGGGGEPEGVNLLGRRWDTPRWRSWDTARAKDRARGGPRARRRSCARMATARARRRTARAAIARAAEEARAATRRAQWEDYDEVWDADAAGSPGGRRTRVSSRRRTRVSSRRRTSASTCTRTAGWKEMTKTTTRMRCETATRTPSRMRRTRRR